MEKVIELLLLLLVVVIIIYRDKYHKTKRKKYDCFIALVYNILSNNKFYDVDGDIKRFINIIGAFSEKPKRIKNMARTRYEGLEDKYFECLENYNSPQEIVTIANAFIVDAILDVYFHTDKNVEIDECYKKIYCQCLEYFCPPEDIKNSYKNIGLRQTRETVKDYLKDPLCL